MFILSSLASFFCFLNFCSLALPFADVLRAGVADLARLSDDSVFAWYRGRPRGVDGADGAFGFLFLGCALLTPPFPF